MPKRVESSGPTNAKIMVVGEAPGSYEEMEGRPFVGPSGDILRKGMLSVGIDPSTVRFTNLCKYRPPKNQLSAWYSKNGMPNSEVIEGLVELSEEIEEVNPNVILACGNFPLHHLTGVNKWNGKKSETGEPVGYTGITDWRGSIIPGTTAIAGGRKVVASLHPASVARNWPTGVFLKHDLGRLKEQALFPEIKPLNKTIIIDPRGKEREYWTDWLLKDKDATISFDIEWLSTGLLCIGMTVHEDYAVVFKIDSELDIAHCKRILENGNPLCAQNAMFDCSVLEYHYGMKLFKNLKHDTMLAQHSAYIELPKDLGTLCSLYTEQPCYWTKIDWKAIKAGQQSINAVLEYNAIDTWVTHSVMRQQLEDDLKNKAVRETFEFEVSLVPVLWEMSRKGIPVSNERVEAIRVECTEKVEEAQEYLDIIAGSSVNPRSSKQVATLLHERLGFPVDRLSKKGNPCTDDKALAYYHILSKTKLQKQAIEIIREIRKNSNMISKFCNIEKDIDGRLRCLYNPGGTNTGRLSSSSFKPTNTGANLQNIPRDKRARKCFIPDEGYEFFYHDLERAESLVVAHLCGDALMLAHHAPGADAHRLLACQLYEIDDPAVINDDQRYMGKQTRHAGNYMEGWKVFQENVNKLAAVTGVSLSAAQAKYFIQRYRDLHPGLTAWWNSTAQEIKTRGVLHNLLGRPRRFYDRYDSVLPMAVAYRPQSTVGDVMNKAIVKMHHDEELNDLGAQMLIQVHDAVGGQIPVKNREAILRRQKELMTMPLINPRTREEFSIPVELAVGPSWGEVKVCHL